MKMNEYISREAVLKKLQMQLLDLEADQDKGEYSELCENRGARDALDEAIYDIRTLKAADVQPVDRWISVDDELPKEWYEVLAYSEMGKIEKAIYVNGRWKLSAFLGETVEDVTHWQPLPEPPKDGDQNE